MGELNGKIDNTLQKAVKSLEKELKTGVILEIPTEKEIQKKTQQALTKARATLTGGA